MGRVEKVRKDHNAAKLPGIGKYNATNYIKGMLEIIRDTRDRYSVNKGDDLPKRC